MSKKYIVERPITVRSANLRLTDEQLDRRAGMVKPALDDNRKPIEGVWVPSIAEGVQFKVGELVEFEDEAEKVLVSNGQLKEVSDSEADEFLAKKEEERQAQLAATSPSEFQRRPVPDRSGSPNARRAGLDTDVAARLNRDPVTGESIQPRDEEEEEEVEEEHEDPVTKEKKKVKVKKKKGRR